MDRVGSLSSLAPPLRDIPGISRKNKSRSPGFWDFRDFSFGIFSGFFSGFFRDFLGISSGFSNPNPDPRDFGIFGILHSGFFRDFLEVLKSRSRSPGFWDYRDFSFGILNADPNSRDTGIFGFFDLAQNKKSRFRIPGITGNRFSNKNILIFIQ